MNISPINFIIESIKNNPEMWQQAEHTFNYIGDQNIQIWTSNLPIFNTSLYVPNRRISFIEKIKLYLSIRKWNKSVPILKFTDLDFKENNNE